MKPFAGGLEAIGGRHVAMVAWPAAIGAWLVMTGACASASDWPVFDRDAARSGVAKGETAITLSSVGRLRRLWVSSIDSSAETAPVVAAGLVFVTSRNGITYALDAATGSIKWRFVTHGPGITTGMPAVDSAAGVVYAPGADGYVHKLSMSGGSEIQGVGFPMRLTLMPQVEKDSAALNLANGYLYAVTSGYLGDFGNYVGHMAAMRLRDGRVHIFNAECANISQLIDDHMCPDIRAGIWARSGPTIDPDPSMGGRVYVATGNGRFDANRGGYDYGDSVIALSPDGSKVLDYFAPSNYEELDATDMDLGSTAPVMLPRQANSKTPLLAIQGAKDGDLRLLNREHLGGVGGELQDFNIGDGVFSAPAAWTDPNGSVWVFVGTSSAVRALRVITDNQGRTRVQAGWTVSGGGTSPVVANGIVFAATNGALRAFDARTGAVRWSGEIGNVHWQSPSIANGRVFVSDEAGRVTAFGL